MWRGGASSWGGKGEKALASTLEQFAQNLHPPESECLRRKEVTEAVNKALKSAFPPPSEVVACPYGSFVSGLFKASSDLDIALQGHVACSLLPQKDALNPAALIDHGDLGQTIPMVKLNYGQRQAVLEHTAKAVQECTCSSLNIMDLRALTARIPIVKMTEVHSNLQVDICCGFAGSAFKNDVISEISSAEPLVKQLFHLVKLWASFYGLNDGTSNTFNTWSLTLMVLFALQTTSPPVLPPMWQCFMSEHASGHMATSTASEIGGEGPSTDTGCIDAGSHLNVNNKSNPNPLDERLLMGKGIYNNDDSILSEELKCALKQCNRWAGVYTRRPAHSCSLLECLQHFFTLWSGIIEGWDAGHYRGRRVSVWMGQLIDCAFKAPYLCLVEDPFDSEDNAARTLGFVAQPYSKLPYIARVLRISSRIVEEAWAGGIDLQEAIIGLFGPHSMPIQLPLARQPAPLDADLTALDGDSGATINTADTWRSAAVLCGHTRWVSSVTFTPDGKYLVSASHDNAIRVWDFSAHPFRNRGMKNRHDNRVNSVAVSPDSKTIISGSSDRTVRSWSMNTGVCTRTASQRACVTCVAFSPGGHEVACGASDQVSILCADTLELATNGAKNAGINVQCVAYSPDGTKLVAAGSNLGALHSSVAIRVFDILRGGPPLLLHGHKDGVQKVAVTPDSTTVVSCSWDKTLRLWDITSGECRRTLPPHTFSLEGHKGKVVGLALAPDGEHAISGSVDKTVRVWNVNTGRLRATLYGHEDGVWTVAVCPHGRLVASGSNDNSIRLWKPCYTK